ncbi:HNH endonuclease, partial [Knoellia subterranea]
TLIPAAFGGRAPADDTATIPGWGVVPGQAARDWVASNLDHPSTNDAGTDSTKSGFVWLRRLFTDPTGRDLVAMDSRQRRFHGGLRRFLELRDPTCRVPWCDAPAVHVDHTRSVHDGGATSAGNGDGLCERHNQVKEHDGWHFTVQSTGLDGTGPHHLRIHTPTGTSYDSTAPPIHGEGWTPPTLRDSAHDWIPDHATEAWHDDWHDAWA